MRIRSSDRRNAHHSPEAMIFGAILLSSIAARFLLIPWDLGGFFWQMFVALLGWTGFNQIVPRLPPASRFWARLLLLPLAGFILFGTLLFDVGALLPFFFIGALATAALWFWSTSDKRIAVILALCPILLHSCCSSRIRHMTQVMQLRNLQNGEVVRIRLHSSNEDVDPVFMDAPEETSRVVATLSATSPYSPNHESIQQPWYCSIVLTDRTSIDFRVGKGNWAHPETVWVEFDRFYVYQNPELYRVLQDQEIRLWDARVEPEQDPEPYRPNLDP